MTDKDKVISGLEKAKAVIENYVPILYQLNSPASIDYAIELLKEQPKPKAAHWVKMRGMMPPEYSGHFECDSCGWHGKLAVREIDFDFCPGCGAKMSIGFPGFDGDDCKSTPLDEILADYLKKMDNENEKEK